jgi:DNA-binding MarR family transcriptional regulator
MVVKSRTTREGPVVPAELDLGHAAFFLGLRINELVAEAMVAEGFADVRQSFGFVIQHLIQQDRSITELAERMEVTQQAASKVVAELLKLGMIEVLPAKDRRTKQIRLSERGWRSVRLARKARIQIDRRLVKGAGATQYEEAKRTLLRCLDKLGGMERIKSRQIRMPR